MLRLRLQLRLPRSILTRLFPYPSAPPISPLHRLLSAAAPRVPPNPSFAVEDYLVGTCGLTPAQALKASSKLSHLKSPSRPDAVLAFLAGLGLSGADVASLVARDPQFLCTRVDATLGPNLVGLTGIGLSHTDIARLASVAPGSFRCRSTVSNLPYCMSLFGSYENLLRVLKYNCNLLSCNVERILKPNVAFLRECRLSDCDIAKLGIVVPRMLTADLERLRAMVASAEGLGVPRGSGMFRQALHAVASLTEEKIAVRLEYLKVTFTWSNAEVRIAVCKAPTLLTVYEVLPSKSKFLISEVGLEPAYIAHRPAILTYNLEGRLRPRYFVFKFLKENGLLRCDRDYYGTLTITEKAFVEKFICPHKEAAPYLAQDYATACRGEVPTRFKPT